MQLLDGDGGEGRGELLMLDGAAAPETPPAPVRGGRALLAAVAAVAVLVGGGTGAYAAHSRDTADAREQAAAKAGRTLDLAVLQVQVQQADQRSYALSAVLVNRGPRPVRVHGAHLGGFALRGSDQPVAPGDSWTGVDTAGVDCEQQQPDLSGPLAVDASAADGTRRRLSLVSGTDYVLSGTEQVVPVDCSTADFAETGLGLQVVGVGRARHGTARVTLDVSAGAAVTVHELRSRLAGVRVVPVTDLPVHVQEGTSVEVVIDMRLTDCGKVDLERLASDDGEGGLEAVGSASDGRRESSIFQDTALAVGLVRLALATCPGLHP